MQPNTIVSTMTPHHAFAASKNSGEHTLLSLFAFDTTANNMQVFPQTKQTPYVIIF